MLSPEMAHLGFPSTSAQSGYYTGYSPITKEAIQGVDAPLNKASIRAKNTRIQKSGENADGRGTYTVLRASIDYREEPQFLGLLESGEKVQCIGGDYGIKLQTINDLSCRSSQVRGNKVREQILDRYHAFFETGDYTEYTESQRLWIKDKQPNVESFFGFVYRYRDPAGARADFQGFVALLDVERSKTLKELERSAKTYIATLPWVSESHSKEGNGPFEKDEYIAPDFNAVHGTIPRDPIWGYSLIIQF